HHPGPASTRHRCNALPEGRSGFVCGPCGENTPAVPTPPSCEATQLRTSGKTTSAVQGQTPDGDRYEPYGAKCRLAWDERVQAARIGRREAAVLLDAQSQSPSRLHAAGSFPCVEACSSFSKRRHKPFPKLHGSYADARSPHVRCHIC